MSAVTNLPEVKQEIGKTPSGFLSTWAKAWKKNKYIYIILMPVLAYYILFHYVPMYGIVIAWKNFDPSLGILKSPWAGWEHFCGFFQSYYFFRLLRNTFLISFYDIIFGFPAPIILALLLNEIKDGIFKRTVQTLSYLPHFISMVIIAGFIINFCSDRGVISSILNVFGVERTPWLTVPAAFRPIYVVSGIWQNIGWESIVFLAALAGVDPQIYEAAIVDGASRWRRMWHVTLPGILPTIMIMLILRLGRVLSVGAEKIILLYNPVTYETADVISSFVYRQGIIEGDYSFTTAVGIFNSVVNLLFLYVSNLLSRRMSQSSLW